VIVGGGNDARDAFEIAAGGGDAIVLILDYADNIGSILTQLETASARKFLLANVPDIGKTPAIQALNAMFLGVAALAAGLAMAMNLALAAELATLPADLLGGGRFLDLFDLVNAVVSEPGAFGLTDVTSACAASLACIADSSSTFFWDGIHSTTAGHVALAHAALAVIPEPSTTVLAAVALALPALPSGDTQSNQSNTGLPGTSWSRVSRIESG
jgi:outer membrane lipase/esterase